MTTDPENETTPIMEAAARVMAAMDDLTAEILNSTAEALEAAAKTVREKTSE